jgi:ParB/RepB/Spo0J family partition protein
MSTTPIKVARRKKSEEELEKERLADFLEGRNDSWLKRRRQKTKATGPLEFSAETIPVLLEALEPHPMQPRHQLTGKKIKQLAESINLHGLTTPLLVMRRPDDPKKFYILDGIRRWHATKMLKMEEVSCNVISQKLRDHEALALMSTMDGTRESFNPIERGRAFRVLRRELNITQDALANFLRIQQSEISRCENLEDALHKDIVDDCLGPEAHWVKHNHLRQLVRLREVPKLQLEFFQRLREEKCGIRRLRQEVNRILMEIPFPSQRYRLEVENPTFKATITRKGAGAISLDDVRTHMAQLNLKISEVFELNLEDLAAWYDRMAEHCRKEYKERLKQIRQRTESSPDYDPDGGD